MRTTLTLPALLALFASPATADPVTAGVLRLLGTMSGPLCSSRPAAVASMPLGRTMVAWVDPTAAGTVILTAVLDESGALVAGPAVIGTNPSGPTSLALAASASGFLLAWDGRPAGLPSDSDVFCVALDPAGAPLGPVQVANSLTGLNEGRPDAAPIPGGGYVLGWIRFGLAAPGTSAGIWVRRFGPAGAPLDAAEVRADAPATNTGWQDAVAVGAWAGGGFFAAWQDGTPPAFGGLPSPDGSGIAILVQWLDAALAPVGPQPLVMNVSTAGDQLEPRLAMDARGRAILAWRESGTTPAAIRYQSVDALGGPVFPVELPIAAPANTFGVFLTSVACDPGGGFALGYTFRNTTLSNTVFSGPCGGGTPGYGAPPPPPGGFTRFPGAGLPAFESIAYAPVSAPIATTHSHSAVASDAFGNLVSVQVGGPGGAFDVLARRYARNQIAFAPSFPAPGASVALTLDTPAGTGDVYIAAASASPGPAAIGSRLLRLAFDPLFALSLTPGNPYFQGFAGPTTPPSTTGPAITIPNLPSLSGVRIQLAFVTGDSSTGGIVLVSDSAPLDIL